MIIVDTKLAERAKAGRPVNVAMFGAGFMAQGIANQIVNSVPGLRLVAICNRSVERARFAYENAGVTAIKQIGSGAELDACITAGTCAITDDPKEQAQAGS